MSQQTIKALLISVGKGIEPVIWTINRLRPECLCFFTSEEDKHIIDREIVPKLEQPPRQWDQMVTPDADDLIKCCQVLVKDLSRLLSRWDVDPSQLVVDYAGGTRVMSAALMLCSINHSSVYRYVTAEGKEQDIPHVNPWDELVIEERKQAAAHFNRARYREAADYFLKIQQRVSGGQKPLYKALANFSLGYAFWDALDYRSAWNKLQESKKALDMATLFGGPAGLKNLVSAAKENLLFLEKMTMGSQEVKPEILLDLLANAATRYTFSH